MKTLQDVRFFLHLGYFPGFKEDICPVDFASVRPTDYSGMSEPELVAKAKSVFLEGIDSLHNPNADLLVPLSGGLDSRALFAGLLEVREASKMTAMTYGTPGTLDFEIGRDLAKSVGVKHRSISLAEKAIELPELIDTAKRFRLQPILLLHPSQWLMEKEFGGCEIWSGYVGDAIAGGHLSDPPSPSLEDAKIKYCTNRRMGKVVAMSKRTPAELAQQIDLKPKYGDFLTVDEELIFLEGARCFTAPHLIYPGFKYVTPLINNDFMRFFLTLPKNYRLNQYLYRKMLFESFQKLFEFPSTATYGGPLYQPMWQRKMRKNIVRAKNLVRRKAPWFPQKPCIMTKYLDFNVVSRKGGIYYDLFAQCIEDLAKREIIDWIDIRGLWKSHQRYELSLGRELQVLVSLEVLLKAGVTIDPKG